MDKEQTITFRNEDPTEAEKELYLYAGFYVIEKDAYHIKYAVCYTDKDMRKAFPKEIQILKEHVDHKSIITFDLSCDSVKASDFIDVKLLYIILKRTKELGWR